MKKLLFVVLTCFFSLPLPAFSYGPYSLIAPIAIDGDTIRAEVPVWPSIGVDASIRVIGVDSPELTSPGCATQAENDAIRAAGRAAKVFTDSWLSRNTPIVITGVKMDAYAGRYDAVVLGSDGEKLADALIKSGHGRKYNGGKRATWCAP